MHVVQRIASLAVIFAWLIVQVPLVACDSECASSLSLAFLSEEHDCHRPESAQHRDGCCGGHAEDTASTQKDQEDSREDREGQHGDHTLLLVPVVAAGEAVAVPTPGVSGWAALIPWPHAKSEHLSVRTDVRAPVPLDPVHLAISLQI